ncbi:hypothetical protein M407DRAFT_225929 [Tulasnella calospora MUT 4182]|uniref:Uncharacterized protein n=1 Tax=Tulasnella calospora MUT 4182 TaxID=1051891 RepID=A0A0C3LA09_9AGAM|nr:hypothetical protein M407DRAFT_225929 [Tulasnella calospora MUT 4182]
MVIAIRRSTRSSNNVQPSGNQYNGDGNGSADSGHSSHSERIRLLNPLHHPRLPSSSWHEGPPPQPRYPPMVTVSEPSSSRSVPRPSGSTSSLVRSLPPVARGIDIETGASLSPRPHSNLPASLGHTTDRIASRSTTSLNAKANFHFDSVPWCSTTALRPQSLNRAGPPEKEKRQLYQLLASPPYSRARPDELKVLEAQPKERKTWTQTEKGIAWEALREYQRQNPGFDPRTSGDEDQRLAYPVMWKWIMHRLPKRTYDGFLTWASKHWGRPTTRSKSRAAKGFQPSKST